jgi:beta-lactamase superfamily II metal-dependent hydrolase
MKTRISVIASGCLAACAPAPHDTGDGCEDHHEAFSLVAPPLAAPSGSLGLYVLDVGQGDAAVVVAPGGCAALLDGGPGGAGNAVIKPSLAALGVTSLDFAIASHYHADHIGGLEEVELGTGAVPIARVYDRGGSYASATFDDYAAHFGNRRQKVNAGESFTLCGEVTFAVIAADANGASTTNENARSVVVKISYGAFDALVGGDLTGASPNIESSIAAAIGELEVYKVHHHGSSTSSNATLVSALLPTVSLIPVGANNSYGHPDPDTVARLQGAGSEIWMTEDPSNGQALGHIEVVTATGDAYQVSQGNASSTHASKGGPSPPPACTVSITQLQYGNGNKQLTIRATSSQQPSAVLSATADGAALGAMSYLASKGYYELKRTMATQPACVAVTASCGGAATRCF